MALKFRNMTRNAKHGVRGRARYVSVTEAHRNIEYLQLSGEEILFPLKPEYREWGASSRAHIKSGVRAPELISRAGDELQSSYLERGTSSRAHIEGEGRAPQLI